MAQRSVTREVPRLSLRASFEPSTVNVEKRTVDLTWTTGARVLRGYFDPYWEELSLDPKHVRMERLQSGAAPLLNAHGSYDITDVLGVVESARLEKGKGTATVRFDSGVEGEDAFRRVREGTLRNVSVGYTTYKMQKVEDGAATTPVYRAIDWEPAEISMVPIGADGGAVTRSAGGMTPCEFLEERAMDPADANPTTPPTPAPAASPAPQPIAADGKERAAIELAARAAERVRVTEIQRVGRALKRPETEITAAVDGNHTLDAFRAAAVDAIASAKPEDGGVISFDKRDARITSGEDRRTKWLRGATAWLMQRAGVAGVIAEAAKLPGWTEVMRARGLSVDVDLDPGEFRGARMLDLARQSLEIGGARVQNIMPMEIIARAFTAQRAFAGEATTGDFPILLENVLYKTLLAQYMTTPDTWTQFCRTGSVQDFRASKRYRMGTFGALSPLNEAGEFTNKSIPDAERQSLTAGTKGNLIAISRQAIINDDMAAFAQLATMLGRGAKLTVELDVYALLALNAGLGPAMSDGNTLFHASHNNITTAATIGSTAIDLDRVAMKRQKDVSGNEVLSLTPAIIVLATELGGTARQINNGQYDFDAVSTKNPWVPNKVAGVFSKIVDTERITGTRRYLFADPGVAPTIEVAFVDGQQQPFLDVKQGWNIDGVEWKVRLDYGVAAIDFRGAVTNAGTP